MDRIRVAVLLLAAAAPAAAQTLQSGPPKGQPLGALRVAEVAGPKAGTDRDAAPDLRKGPAAILFVHELTRETAPMIRAFDEGASELAVLGLRALTVHLPADRTEAEQRIPVVSKALRLLQPITVSADGAEGPGSYALNRKASLTLVLARDGIVRDSIAFTDTGQKDVDWLHLSLQSMTGSVPKDGELRAALLRSLPADREALADLVANLERQRRALFDQRLEAANNPQRPGMQGGQGMAGQRMQGSPERPANAPERSAPAEAEVRLTGILTDEATAKIVRKIVTPDAAGDALADAFTALADRVRAEPLVLPQVNEAFRAVLATPGYGSEAARERMRTWLADHR
jgi:hypothetical protein